MSERHPYGPATPPSPPVPVHGAVPEAVPAPAMAPRPGYATYPPPFGGHYPQPVQRMPTPAAAYGALGTYGPPHRPSSGLFPGPSRPVYRETHPVTAAAVVSGLGAGLLWFGLFGGLAHDLAAYAWWTIVAAVSAWAVAIVLTVLGDRGVAVGVAIASGAGLSIAMVFVGHRWISTYDWPLW